MSHVHVGCVPPVRQFRLCGMQKSFGSEHFDSLDESWANMEAEPFPGVATPLDVEAVGADPVETGEGRTELSPRFSGKPKRLRLLPTPHSLIPCAQESWPLQPDLTLLLYIQGQR